MGKSTISATLVTCALCLLASAVQAAEAAPDANQQLADISALLAAREALSAPSSDELAQALVMEIAELVETRQALDAATPSPAVHLSFVFQHPDGEQPALGVSTTVGAFAVEGGDDEERLEIAGGLVSTEAGLMLAFEAHGGGDSGPYGRGRVPLQMGVPTVLLRFGSSALLVTAHPLISGELAP
ncbi:MAG: hypothetical protein PF961_11045 [Planctomycetota bacterium]|jgi:hypothetical protein|nr:hypothetical protein [Planctomycetota bacterium]